MDFLSQSAFLKALGWALLNTMWQFGLLWLIFIFFVNGRKTLTPAIKHGFSLLLISAGFAWFAGGLCYQYFAYSNATDQDTNSYFAYNSSLYSVAYEVGKNFLESNLSYLSFIYLFIVGTLFIKFFRFFYNSHTIQTKGLMKLPAELRIHIQQLVQQLDIRLKVRVWVSECVDTIMVLGFLKPTILIPLASINQLSVKQLEAILLHELAHIKRNDYLINLYVATTEILFFFNPFARLLITSLKQERENCCDDWVLQFRFDPHQYASALLALEQSRSTSYSLAIAATGESKNILLHRVQRIMNVKKSDGNNGFKFLAYIMTIGFLWFLAFADPGETVMKKVADNSSAVNNSLTVPSREMNSFLTNPNKIVPVNKKNDEKRSKPDRVSRIEKKVFPTATAEEHPDDIHLLTRINQGINNFNTLSIALNIEERDYSIHRKEKTDLPLPLTIYEFPFVPHSSFDYHLIEDTSSPKIKAESYQEMNARESLEKAQKAIEKLDWKKIEKQLKNTVNIVSLRKQIEQSLEQLNWQQINKEVKESIDRENSEKMRASIKQEYEKMNLYRTRQQEYQKIKSDLEYQQEKYKRDAEIKLLEIQKKLAKIRMIVFI